MNKDGSMRILVTAGNTLTPIDRVRGISNFSTGRTGTQIALAALQRGHDVVLLTSHPELVATLHEGQPSRRWRLAEFKTYDELERSLEHFVRSGNFDVIVHAAAVSDYRSGGLFRWQNGKMLAYGPEAGQEKIKSNEPELWLKLVRTLKLIDQMKQDWGFRGSLVKFKLEVNLDEQQLLAIAENSRVQSGADLMVANTLEQVQSWAYLGPIDGKYELLSRTELPRRLLEAIEGKRA